MALVPVVVRLLTVGETLVVDDGTRLSVSSDSHSGQGVVLYDCVVASYFRLGGRVNGGSRKFFGPRVLQLISCLFLKAHVIRMMSRTDNAA